MTDIREILERSSQGTYFEEKPFALVAVAKDGMSSQVFANANIEKANEKCFMLCACTLEDSDDILLYLSNDPNDFIYNSTVLANNHGVVPIRKVDDYFKIDIIKRHKSETVYLPKNNPFKINQRTEYNSLNFNFVKNNNRTNKLHHGIAYEISFTGKERINFSMRQNLPVSQTGRIGPSVAWLSGGNGVFEYLRTASFAREGVSFVYNTDHKILGMSRLVDDTPAKPFTSIGPATNTCIIELKQGTSTAYNIFHNPSGVSDVYLNYGEGVSFLNTTTFNPDPANGGLSVKINIRNASENFIALNDITASTDEIFDYYIMNLGDFTSGGVINDSSQYLDDNGNMACGVCYYFDKQFFYYESFHNEHNKGLMHLICQCNETAETNTTTNNTLLSNKNARADTSFSTNYDAMKAIDFSQFNSYDPGADSGTVRALDTNKGYSNTYQDSLKNLDKENGEIFTTNNNKGQKTYLIEIIFMGVLLLIFIIFSIYYYNLEIIQN